MSAVWISRLCFAALQTGLVCLYQSYRAWRPIGAWGTVLLVAMNVSFLVLTCVPPGYVQRGSKQELVAAVRKRKDDAERRAASTNARPNDAEGLMEGHADSGGLSSSSLSTPAVEEDEETGRITVAGLRMCHECQILTPLRAKHDRWSGRCVYRHDHYCVWVGELQP